ncbi:hypothetical protein EDC96DRAFT_36096 [Choanephora cucurbitarum]|nr:hypothetical protein EDC96DRAFT_36096 [Choanephora cucurbitarum]
MIMHENEIVLIVSFKLQSHLYYKTSKTAKTTFDLSLFTCHGALSLSWSFFSFKQATRLVSISNASLFIYLSGMLKVLGLPLCLSVSAASARVRRFGKRLLATLGHEGRL